MSKRRLPSVDLKTVPTPPVPPKGKPVSQATDTPGGAESADPNNPNAPSQNEADAASEGNNDTSPLREVVQDEPGMEDHSAAAEGTDAVHQLLIETGAAHDRMPPETFEAVGSAVNHLGDAYRQANFGKHEGATVSVGHAAQALGRARDTIAGNPAATDTINRLYNQAVTVGNTLIDKNENRPPWNPLPTKTHRGLPVVEVKDIIIANSARTHSGGGDDQPRDDHGRFSGTGGGDDDDAGHLAGATGGGGGVIATSDDKPSHGQALAVVSAQLGVKPIDITGHPSYIQAADADRGWASRMSDTDLRNEHAGYHQELTGGHPTTVQMAANQLGSMKANEDEITRRDARY